ncbi:MAG: response regulator [Trueperaceae bacterium]|nr:response regulator [Trueperaceae bacterium]
MKILVIDDSPAMISMIESILRQASHNVKTCNDSEEAEAQIAQEQPDLVLLDVVMPKKSGYDILRKLKRNADTKHIPVVLVSSKQEESDIMWGKRQGAADYLGKPFDAEGLLAVVSRFEG